MTKKILIFYILFILFLSFFWATFILDWALENILTLLFIFFLFFNKINFSKFSYSIMWLFLTLHIIGSHYAYNVPIMNDLMNYFNLSRNHFDRIVHFSFWLCFTIPTLEILKNTLKIKSFLTAWFIATFILIWFWAIYEILEYLIVILVVPELWQAFLWSQWDIWDAQKDMSLWFLWSLIILFFYSFFEKNEIKK